MFEGKKSIAWLSIKKIYFSVTWISYSYLRTHTLKFYCIYACAYHAHGIAPFTTITIIANQAKYIMVQLVKQVPCATPKTVLHALGTHKSGHKSRLFKSCVAVSFKVFCDHKWLHASRLLSRTTFKYSNDLIRNACI